MTELPGVGGHLFPSQFLAERAGPMDPRAQASWLRWWTGVARACGPATGARTVFDLVAAPLFARLGFQARDLAPAPGGLAARLLTPRGRSVALYVLPWRGWAARPPAPWRDAVALARDAGADWCLILAPPSLSLVPARGHASRRALDFTFPDALESRAAALLTTLGHASAFDGRLDDWLTDAARFHARLHTDLQHGVVEALHALTRVLHRRRSAPTAFDEALTLVYRVLFLLFAESRALVPVHHPIYREAYTLTALCADAMRGGTVGFWDALAAITTLSRTGGSVDSLHVFPFNGHLFARRAAPSLEDDRGATRPTARSRARDHALRHTLLSLGTRQDPAGRMLLNYADLGVEQLGAVYERVLDLDPAFVIAGEPDRSTPARHSDARKDTGTFYTPQSIADLTVRRTLGPLVDGMPADRILSLRIVDPAMGSGAFLVAALRYLTDAYERAVVKEGRYAPFEIDDATRAEFRRAIAQRCLYGVDNNPVAVQVARLSVWLATLAHGKPLSFLDHRLRVGNSLLGTTSAAVRRPIGARDHDMPLFDDADRHLRATMRHIAAPLARLASQPDTTVQIVREKEREWARLSAAGGLSAAWRSALHLWCARWFWPDAGAAPAPAELAAAIDALTGGTDRLGGGHVARWCTQAGTAAEAHHFFHWPLEFADAFYDSDGTPLADAGFDAVIGNPPWEMVRRDKRSGRRGSGRDPLVGFIRESGLFPLCRTGHVNLYQPFVDRALQLLKSDGRLGLVLPWGFAVDDGAADLRRTLIETGALDTIIGFDNARGLFPIHRGLRFAIIVARSHQARSDGRDARARCGVMTEEQADAIPEAGHAGEESAVPVRLAPRDLAIVGGPLRRIPDLRRPDDFEWLRQMHRFPALGAPDGWGLTFGRELNATDDAHLFREREAGRGGLPVVEGKHIAPFVCDISACTRVINPRDAGHRLPDRRFERPRLAYRDVSGVGNTHALVAAVIPGGVVTTHTLFCLRTPLPVDQQLYLCGLFNSPVLDRFVRLLMGSHVTTTLIEQLPVPIWTGSPLQQAIAALVAGQDTAGIPALVGQLYTQR